MTLPVQATVYEPMYEYNEKKYLRITLPDKVRDYIRELHRHKTKFILFPNKLDEPLEGNVLKVKVPFGGIFLINAFILGVKTLEFAVNVTGLPFDIPNI